MIKNIIVLFLRLQGVFWDFNIHIGKNKTAYMASQVDQQIETIFNSFDKDKSGTIELNELKEVAQALGEKLPEDQLTEIVKNLDTNGDGKISLDEFKFWWNQGLKGKLGNLVYLKAKSLKMTEDFVNKFNKAGVDIASFDKQTSVDIMSMSVSCGESAQNTIEFDASIYHRGDRFKWELKQLKEKGVTWFNEKEVNFVLLLPSDDPAKAKQQLSALLTKMTSSGAMPFLEGGDDNPFIKIKFQALKDCLALHIEVKQALMELFAGPTKQFDTIDSLFGENFYIFFQTTFGTNFSIDDLLSGGNIIETLLKGFYFNISGQAPNCVLKKFREMLESSGKTEGTFQFLSSLLLKSGLISLNIKSPEKVDKFYEKMGIKDILNQCPNLCDLLQQFSLAPEVQQMKFNTESPQHFMYQFLKCLKSNINSGVQLYAQRGQTLLVVKTKIPNAHKIFNILFNEV